MNSIDLFPYKTFTFRLSSDTGGKAGKGHNQTRSFHAWSDKYCKGRYFSFYHEDSVAMQEAYWKARKWIDKIIKEAQSNLTVTSKD